MPRRTVLSSVFATLGAVLLLAAVFAATASSASRPAAKPLSKRALKGGTLRVNASNNDFEFSDPGIAYDTLSWSMLYTTQMLLVNFPEKSGQARQRPLSGGRYVVPDGVERRQDVHVPHPAGPEVQ
jgi:hypothetical protein